MNKDRREKKGDQLDQKKIEKQAKEKLDNLLRLKPKDYKNVEYEKAKKEVYEEEIQKLKRWYLLNIYQF